MKKIILPTIALGVVLVPTLSTNVHAANINCNTFAKTIDEAICMQDMNDSVKESMVLERQYELRDKRDGKRYYIAKLADGNVWMTQNLDFDIDKNITLTPEDTDVKSNWKPKESTYWVDDLMESEPEPTPQPKRNGASEVSEDISEEWYNHQHSVDVGDLYWDGTIVDNNVLSPADDISGVVPEYEIGNTATSGNRHYHLGNYYNWLAATASDDDTSFLEAIEGDAEQSVCPAGWTLPSLYGNFLQGRSISSEKPSVADLIMAYYYDEGTDTYAWKTAPEGAPLYLNFSDNYDGNVGSSGSIWTSSFINRNGTLEGGYAEPQPELALTGSPIKGYMSYYYSDDVDYSRVEADMMVTSVRCVARSRVAVDANWVKGQTYDEEDPEEAVLLIDANIDELDSITLDGELVSEGANMAVAPDDNGGFTVTFAPEFLETLEEGDHVVRATFTSGNSVYAKLTVSRTSIAVPNTGANTADVAFMNDNNNLMTAIAFTVICFGVMAVVYRATHSKFKGF
ncbi:hypothetical protein IJS18_01600 [Candidatus Saccharibacteria bacterium]|nr:hypothetical protein [Candidatus Saccharibacteria bacterium]